MFGRVGSRNDGGGGSNGTCTFFLQGRCKFGDNCKFDHPRSGQQQQSTTNRFSSLSNQPSNSSGTRGRQTDSRSQQLPYYLSKENIILDLKEERPIWPLSSYGAGRDAPRQLIEGPIEQSPEEMRVLYYAAQAAGNPQPAQQHENELVQKSNQQIQQILNNVDGALEYLIAGENEHPNRRELAQGGSNSNDSMRANPFSGANPSTGNAFGKPSMPGASQPAFGASAFGKPSSPFAGAGQSSAFGKPAFGQSSAFGQPSQPGATSAFGQPSQVGTSTAFGQPPQPGSTNAFGQPPQSSKTSAFSQPSQPGAVSAFGQPSQPGATSAFGQPSQPGATSAFGQPSQSVATSAFGQTSQVGATSAFGQPSQPGATGAFGKPSQIGATGAFGQPSQPSSSSPFGQASQPGATGGFGQPSAAGGGGAFGLPSSLGQNKPAFGQPSQANQSSPFASAAISQPTSGFGQPSNVGAKPSPFGAQPSAFGQPSQFGSSPFGAKPAEAASASPFAQTAAQSTNGAFGRPSTFSPFGHTSQSAASSTVSPFGAPSAPTTSASPFGHSQNTVVTPQPMTNGGHSSSVTPDPSTYISRDGTGRLRSFKNQPVTYVSDEPHYRNPQSQDEPERIWFPDGPPAQANKYSEEDEETYQALGSAMEDAFRFLAETAEFKDGVMPHLAPKRAWVRFDL